MRWHVYLKGHVVFVPTTGRLDEPIYREMEPVAVLPISDAEGVRRALEATIARGNPPAPRYSAGNFPPPVLLKYAGAKTWSAFARNTLTWSIEQTDNVYQIVPYRKDAEGYWEADPDRNIVFQPGTTTDAVIERMISIMEEAATTGTQ
ncbi:MAG TPA: hypothetical protein VFW44_17790 [Bryobacteraceae bacterium]|nr:hypothetical protein [Bryobacteraceae bacterium]